MHWSSPLLLGKRMAWRFARHGRWFINQSSSLGLVHVLDPYLRRWADRALAGAWNPASRDSSPSREGAIREWA
jgi:hypothetical protein